MAEKQVDILIVGGGLTGATLMLALKNLGFSALLVEAKALSTKINPDFDARSLALSPASQRILNSLGVWNFLKPYATAIHHIHVSEQYRFGTSRLQGDEKNPLGYVVEMQHINMVLHELLTHDHILAPATLSALDLENKTATVKTEQGESVIKAQLIVAADGADSAVRRFCHLSVDTKQYNQRAIVANIGLAKAHENRAYERFTANGPLALLPMTDNRMSLVWAMPPQKAEQLMSVPEADFLKELQNAFGYRLGRFTKAGKRVAFPLMQAIMKKQIKGPAVFLGNAAHTLHPVAGQGFNLGLRDAATLAQCISQQGLTENMLKEYVQLRHHDQQIITRFTDGLVQLFTSRLPGLGLMRTIGFITFENSPFLKNILAHYARGFGGFIPDLVCDIPLNVPEKK